MDRTTLGNRMKGYEALTQNRLMRRTPVVVRVDGKAFHTWTKNITTEIDPTLIYTPFSVKLHDVMINTAEAMCTQMQNAVFAYTQSDEISILLRDWDRHETEQWFDAKVQKIVSVSSAMATAYFNNYVQSFMPAMSDEIRQRWIGQIPLFDARAFNLPKDEITNYFVWRQQDASRNSVQMVGRHFFSAKQMHGKNNSQVQDMLMAMESPLNWNDLPTWMKRGTCVIENPNSFNSSCAYKIDENIPIFTQKRDYIESRLEPEVDELTQAYEESQFRVTPDSGIVKKGGPGDPDQYKKS